MSRELLLWILTLLFVGSLNIVSGTWMVVKAPVVGASAQLAERQAWRALWWPLLPGALVLAFLLGWALQEPESAEALHAWAYLTAVPLALVWLRAAVRAWRSGSATEVRLAGTVGLLRPKVVIAPELRSALDERALAAAEAHEAAHARRRDPLRLWLAQVATDLQWPASGARRRFEHWREVLEIARDEEACQRSKIDGPDLAAAVLVAARLGGGAGRGAVAPLGARHGAGLNMRVRRLLREGPAAVFDESIGLRAGVRRGITFAVLAAMVGMIVVGYLWGEPVVSHIADM